MRTLRCTRCLASVDVHETPVEFIEPDLYVCSLCRMNAGLEQLAIDAGPSRTETRPYDPSVAQIPYGDAA